MIVLLPATAWGHKDAPWMGLPEHTLVIIADPTRGGGGPSGPLVCYLAGRVFEGKIAEWRNV